MEDPLNSTFANSLRLSTDADLSASISARDRRRAKEVSVSILAKKMKDHNMMFGDIQYTT